MATLCDWLKYLAPLSQPIRNKTQTNRDLLPRVFPRLAPALCIRGSDWVSEALVGLSGSVLIGQSD